MNRLKTKLLAVIYTFALSTNAHTTVVVEASRLETLFERYSGTALLISRDEIQKMHDFSLDELLARYSSLSMSRQGAQSSLFLRGSNSSHVIVLLNGVKLNDPSNPSRQYDFSKISTSSIEKIEILQGPQSVLYGGDATGGVISITTKFIPQSSVQLSLGRYQDKKIQGQIGQRIGDINLSTSLDLQKKEGFSYAENSTRGPVTNDGRTLINIQQLLETQNMSAFVRVGRDRFDLDRFTSAGLVDDPNNYGEDEQLQIGFRKKGNYYSKLKYNYSAGVQWQNRKTFQLADEVEDENKTSIFRSRLLDLKLSHRLESNPQWSTLFGVDLFSEEALFPQKENANTTGIFVQQRMDRESYFISLGARLENHQYLDDITTQSFSIGFYPLDLLTVKYHYGTGFKAPSLFQLFDQSYGNSYLSPEKSRHHELSFQFNQNHQLSFFETRYSNLIGFDPVSFQSVNEGNSLIRGVELQTRILEKQDHLVSFDITALKAVNTDTNADLLRRPRQKAGLKWEASISEKWKSYLQTQWQSKRAEFSGESLEAFTEVNLLLKYSTETQSQTYLKLENLFKAQNNSAAGFQTGGRIWTIGFKKDF